MPAERDADPVPADQVQRHRDPDRVQRHRSGPSAATGRAPITGAPAAVGRASRERRTTTGGAPAQGCTSSNRSSPGPGGGRGRRARWRRRGAHPGLLDQGFGGTERHVHGDEQPEQLQQDLHEALTRGAARVQVRFVRQVCFTLAECRSTDGGSRESNGSARGNGHEDSHPAASSSPPRSPARQ